MPQNPILQIALFAVGAYYGLNFCSRFWPPLGPIVTVACGVFAAVIWLLEHERRLAADLHRSNPIVRPILELVCRATGRPMPSGEPVAAVASADVGAARAASPPRAESGGERVASAPAGAAPAAAVRAPAKLALEIDADFYDAAARLKRVVRGHDTIVDGLFGQLRQSARLRGRSDPNSPQPPLGMFLLVGKTGLGKRYLAEQMAWLLYADGPLLELDLADEGSQSPRRLIEAVKARPSQTIVLENVDAAPAQFLERLQAIAAGNALRDPTSGAVVSFKGTVFFLIAHKPADRLAEIKKSSVTQLTATVAELVGLPPSLVTMITDYHAFLLPTPIEQAEIVALLMDQECRKFNVRLGRVDPEMLTREVAAITASGGFAIAPGRIAKRLQGAIHDTIARNGDTVNLVTEESTS